MTGADIIRALLDAEIREPGIINRPISLHPHGNGYRQRLEHVYVSPIRSGPDGHTVNRIVFESKRD